MSSQRYERVAAHDDEGDTTQTPYSNQAIPSSPPPSFRSHASSPTSPSRRRLLSTSDPLASEAERTLADTFDSPSDSESDDDQDREHGADDRQRLMRAQPESPKPEEDDDTPPPPPPLQRRTTEFPGAQVPGAHPLTGVRRIYGGGANDGVFANLSAKPQRGDDLDEKPPTYEQAAADATPPYWETTILAPGMSSDEVFVDGLPVGSLFGFVWNAMISMSFQIVGFILTYLLHTTHAAKNGSRAGLGITLVQYGFSMKGAASLRDPGSGNPADAGPQVGGPPDPGSHDFDPNVVAGDNNALAAQGAAAAAAAGAAADGGIAMSDWFAYLLMIVGWFILIRAISDFIRARRHEQLVLQSPERGLGTPVVAEGERPESTV
ncbi:hypothetical protein K402DRAFT_419634 [Aulographum hederae CBS 113979]|uniref:Metal homeostatis protein bsd2 n=1 Tax=Aulographum hederae CBS 113979 TaxID=1176131 RepID=A0A6G1H4Z5_9PEZI|nr:hypothetical protein K402DRAFT_419634 [Aulographum hederae CBS 113979]